MGFEDRPTQGIKTTYSFYEDTILLHTTPKIFTRVNNKIVLLTEYVFHFLEINGQAKSFEILVRQHPVYFEAQTIFKLGRKDSKFSVNISYAQSIQANRLYIEGIDIEGTATAFTPTFIIFLNIQLTFFNGR